jgi:hypothetical protein
MGTNNSPLYRAPAMDAEQSQGIGRVREEESREREVSEAMAEESKKRKRNSTRVRDS